MGILQSETKAGILSACHTTIRQSGGLEEENESALWISMEGLSAWVKRVREHKGFCSQQMGRRAGEVNSNCWKAEENTRLIGRRSAQRMK